MKSITLSEVKEMIAELQADIDEGHRKIKTYDECMAKGLYGYVDLKFKVQSEIEQKQKLIELLQHPERNPQLSIRFDVSPKPLRTVTIQTPSHSKPPSNTRRKLS